MQENVLNSKICAIDLRENTQTTHCSKRDLEWGPQMQENVLNSEVCVMNMREKLDQHTAAREIYNGNPTVPNGFNVPAARSCPNAARANLLQTAGILPRNGQNSS